MRASLPVAVLAVIGLSAPAFAQYAPHENTSNSANVMQNSRTGSGYAAYAQAGDNTSCDPITHTICGPNGTPLLVLGGVGAAIGLTAYLLSQNDQTPSPVSP